MEILCPLDLYMLFSVHSQIIIYLRIADIWFTAQNFCFSLPPPLSLPSLSCFSSLPSPPPSPLLPSFPPPLPLSRSLQPLLNNFEMVWELVITNEVQLMLMSLWIQESISPVGCVVMAMTFPPQPLAVLASSPTLCANTVQALVRYSCITQTI